MSGEEDIEFIVLAIGSSAAGALKILHDLDLKAKIVRFRRGGNICKLIQGDICLNRLVNLQPLRDATILRAVADLLSALGGKTHLVGEKKLCGYLATNLNKMVVGCQLRDAAMGLDRVQDGDGLFVCETEVLKIMDAVSGLKRRFPSSKIVTLRDVVETLPRAEVPAEAVFYPEYSIYPIAIPEISVEHGLDFLLLDLPARFLEMMPNGLGYVHNILKGTGVAFQTLDLDMIFYHRYHYSRIYDAKTEVVSASGKQLPLDPWEMDKASEVWSNDEILEYFQDEMTRLVDEIVAARPKIVGISLHTTNNRLAQELVQRVRLAYPEVVVVVGGYDCVNPHVGPRVFTDYDYMVVFEAEKSLPLLTDRILKGEKVRAMPGVISRYDLPGTPFVPAALEYDLQSMDFPKYEWTDVKNYTSYNGVQLTPIILSRGCKWSRCTFCGERFEFRKRTAVDVVNEIEWMVNNGRKVFHFNDSDLSGDPQLVRAVCEEMLARGIRGVDLQGQLRVQKGYSLEYFKMLKAAGFNQLRYGVDTWSAHTLKLQKKGYTVDMIKEVLGYTKAAGITVYINLVIGIPHETEDDISEIIQNIVDNRDVVDRIENLNTLMLGAGSVYWEDPEGQGIRFRRPREELYNEFPRFIPSQYWYSEEPYIDQAVRVERLRRILDSLKKIGMPIGSFADWRVSNLLS